jgi:hypothetical protein
MCRHNPKGANMKQRCGQQYAMHRYHFHRFCVIVSVNEDLSLK